MPGAYILPKGHPAEREHPRNFIAWCQHPAPQVAPFACHGMTTHTPQASALDLDDLKRFAVTSEENLPRVLLNDPVWWAENGGDTLNRYLDAIS